MLDYAYQNDVIMKNPCNGMVKSDIGKPSQKKEALTLLVCKLVRNQTLKMRKPYKIKEF